MQSTLIAEEKRQQPKCSTDSLAEQSPSTTDTTPQEHHNTHHLTSPPPPEEELLDLCDVTTHDRRAVSHSHSRLGSGIRKLFSKSTRHQSSRERSSEVEATEEHSLTSRSVDGKPFILARKLTATSLFRKRDNSNSRQSAADNTPSSNYSATEGNNLPPTIPHRRHRASSAGCRSETQETPSSSPSHKHLGLFHRLSNRFIKRDESNSTSNTRLRLSTAGLDSDSTADPSTPTAYTDLSLGAFKGINSNTPKTSSTSHNNNLRSPEYSIKTLNHNGLTVPTSPVSVVVTDTSSPTTTTTPTTFNGSSTTTMSTTKRRYQNLPKGSLDAALARGLLVSPAPGPLPVSLSNNNTIEILPQRLYWLTTVGSNRPNAPDTYFFNLDNELVYEPFFADFGPLNLGHTFRYCELLEEKLTDPLLVNKRIVHYSTPDLHKRPNAAYLMAAFCVVILGWSPEAAAGRFERIQPPLLPFRDATYGACNYQLTIMDCAKGLHKGISLGWFDFDTFDINTYEYYERLENGDLNWIIPNKFVAFSGPEGARRPEDDDVYITFTPNDYVPIFKRLGVKLVIRLNKKQYDRKMFTSQGIDHIDLYFLDGSCPSKEILYRFIDIAERQQGAIAVHCKAGLGRTGTLIGCYAIKHFGFTGPEWIAWNRICRPGSVLGPQQHFLCEIEKELLQTNIPKPVVSQTINQHTDLAGLLQEMSLDDRRTAEKGDLGQGLRLVSSKRQVVKSGVSDARSPARSSDTTPTTTDLSIGSPTALLTPTNGEDEIPASTPAFSRDHSVRHNHILTPTATQSPVTKLPRRVQPEDTMAKPTSAVTNDQSLTLLSRSFVNSSVNKSN